MKISLKLTQNVYFTIQKAFDNLFTEDDVRLNIIIKNHNYFIQQDSFRYEIGYNLKYHICNIKSTKCNKKQHINEQKFAFILRKICFLTFR